MKSRSRISRPSPFQENPCLCRPLSSKCKRSPVSANQRNTTVESTPRGNMTTERATMENTVPGGTTERMMMEKMKKMTMSPRGTIPRVTIRCGS
ncbi:hypothetical protein I7I48_09804 [Histoplasma ohiense]|nr:hypothetical protein I7I48_09804 [Histoplasma ohiense (nom. inval.)]